jgi:hypothetical protein
MKAVTNFANFLTALDLTYEPSVALVTGGACHAGVFFVEQAPPIQQQRQSL